MGRWFDREGNQISLEELAALFEDRTYALVGRDERDGVLVSTVWLGSNHAWDGGPPLIFETMIFGGEHDQDQWRYSTEEQAIEGHQKAIAIAFGEA